MTRILATTLLFTLSVSSANAHVGHLGELAGHSHWVGAAALVGAAAVAALAALAAKAKKDAKAKAEAEDDGAAETEDHPGGASA